MFLAILQILMVPTAAGRARQDRRGPSLRPCLRSDPQMELVCFKTQRFLAILCILRVPMAPTWSWIALKSNVFLLFWVF